MELLSGHPSLSVSGRQQNPSPTKPGVQEGGGVVVVLGVLVVVPSVLVVVLGVLLVVPGVLVVVPGVLMVVVDLPPVIPLLVVPLTVSGTSKIMTKPRKRKLETGQ